jgi:hypothetical protein
MVHSYFMVGPCTTSQPDDFIDKVAHNTSRKNIMMSDGIHKSVFTDLLSLSSRTYSLPQTGTYTPRPRA